MCLKYASLKKVEFWIMWRHFLMVRLAGVWYLTKFVFTMFIIIYLLIIRISFVCLLPYSMLMMMIWLCWAASRGVWAGYLWLTVSHTYQWRFVPISVFFLAASCVLHPMFLKQVIMRFNNLYHWKAMLFLFKKATHKHITTIDNWPHHD